MYSGYSRDVNVCPGILQFTGIVFATILTTVFVKAVDRYMTKYFAAKTTCNSFYS